MISRGYALFLLMLTAIALTIVLAACSDDSPTNSGELVTGPYTLEAQIIALYETGELEPPVHLSRTIERELTILRGSLGRKYPVVNTGFAAPWVDSRVNLDMDDTTLANIMSGQNAEFNSLCDDLDADYSVPFPNWQFIRVQSRSPKNPIPMAKLFVAFPGIQVISTSSMGLPIYNALLRHQSGRRTDYFFVGQCDGLHWEYSYFTIEQNRPRFEGYYNCCLTIPDSLLYDEPEVIYEYYEDQLTYLENNRPDWVDSARILMSELNNGEHFLWCRDTIHIVPAGQ